MEPITQLPLPRTEDVVRREMDATWERYARLNDPESLQLDRLALLSRFTDLALELNEVVA
ncbi:MAG: hypothetical protein QOI89_2717 [Solirubrobacteraceae bacterium]|nr:hypothetical protein [Solirubrobacteraceae bacterium]